MRDPSSDTEGVVHGDRKDAAEQLVASLREVNQHALSLTLERDGARMRADELGKRLAASQEQIDALSQQLTVAREQVDDSTRRLAVALEQAADSTRRLSVAREEIVNLAGPKEQVAGPSQEGEESRSGAGRWHPKNLVTGRRVGVLIALAIITYLFVNPIAPTLPSAWGGRSSTAQPALAGPVKQNSAHLELPTIPTVISPHRPTYGKNVNRRNPTRASNRPSLPKSSHKRAVLPSSIVCLHGCRADIEIKHGVFVVKTFPNDRAYTKYLRLHHFFVEMVSGLGLDRHRQDGSHASSVKAGKHTR